jgi:hypothetical protein
MSDTKPSSRPSAICGDSGVASSLQSDCGDFVRTSVLNRLPTILEATCELNSKTYDADTLLQIMEMATTLR